MLRVGLTGELGSGKSTVAQMLAAHGAVVLSSDEMGRAMMQPGHAVFAQIVAQFGPSILKPDGTLNRHALAHLAFDPNNPRIEELNAIIHPAVIAAQAEKVAEIARARPNAIIVVESALIFSTKRIPGSGLRDRFDCIIGIDATDELKIARFIERMRGGRDLTLDERLQLEEDARKRLAHQRTPVTQNAGYLPPLFVLANNGTLSDLEQQVSALWPKLVALEKNK